uniref:Ion transport domain-containing protein n=1 Tax=Romanomermis culicivorax TaxID=13658 RepID=A0A915HJI3_ROMCU
FRILRIFRLLKFVRYSDDLQILAYTFRAATKELYMLFLFLMITLLIFSSLIYHIEKDMPGSEFTSVPAACWWGIGKLVQQK